MNPHEFVRYTAKTNCGECGHPACLAFAVAVTRGGADPSLCPYVNRDLLPEVVQIQGEREGTGLDKVDRGQGERDMALVAHLKFKVRDLDFQEAARALGAEWSSDYPDMLTFSYIGQPVELSKESVRIAGGEAVDPRDQILLYNYLALGGGRAPDGTWVGLESLPNSISKVRTLETYCEQRLAKRFSGRSAQLLSVCQHIGCLPGPLGQSADCGAIIPVLPHLPQYLLFWDEVPEDGFAARVKILFDHYVMDYLDLESLVFAAERLADRMAELDT